MDSIKLALVFIFVFTTGVYVLPSTVSLFAGQHLWYDVNPSGNQIPCVKCHADILEELSSSPYHIKQKGDPTKADNEDCSFCHRVNSSITYAKGDGAGSWVGKEAHAASLIQCMYCHNASLYGAPRAGGFGITSNASDSGIYAAHKSFVLEAGNESLMLGENEACISCHTQINLSFNYTTPRMMGIEISESYSADGTSVSQSWNFNVVDSITYRVNTADRTTKGSYGVIG